MNDKDMAGHIKALIRIIDKQNEYNERLQKNLFHMERRMSILDYKIAKIEGMKNELD